MFAYKSGNLIGDIDYVANLVMSTGDKDISVPKGAPCQVIHNFGNGWMKVNVSGQIGVIPSNYVQVYSS